MAERFRSDESEQEALSRRLNETRRDLDRLYRTVEEQRDQVTLDIEA